MLEEEDDQTYFKVSRKKKQQAPLKGGRPQTSINKPGSGFNSTNNKLMSNNERPETAQKQAEHKKKQIKMKKKLKQNNLNYTDGKIKISYQSEDLTKKYNDYEQSIPQYFKLNIEELKTKNFIENLKTGSFQRVNHNAITNILQGRRQNQQAKIVDNLEVGLNSLVSNFNDVISKSFIFFQGALVGLFWMHLYLIASVDKNQVNEFSNYARMSLRIFQYFHICAFLSVIGGVVKTQMSKEMYEIGRLQQRPNLGDLRVSFYKDLMSTTVFIVVFLIIVYNHKFVSIISSYSTDIANVITTDQEITIFKTLNLFSAIVSLIHYLYNLKKFSLIAWILIVANQQSISQLKKQHMQPYNQLSKEEFEDED